MRFLVPRFTCTVPSIVLGIVPGIVLGIAVTIAACNDDAPPADVTGSASGSSATTAADASTSGETTLGSNTVDGTSITTLPQTSGPSDSTGSNVPMPESVDYAFCELDAPQNASVVGTTPEGPFEGRWAWFGWLTCNGEGLSPTLVVVEDPADLAAAVMVSPSGDAVPTPSIEWYLFGACSPEGGWVGEGNVTVYLRTDGPWHQAGGQIEVFETHRIFDTVDPQDPPRMHGVLTIDEGEWSVAGEFTAHYCGPLSYPLGCE